MAENEEWTTVIKAKTGWFDIELGELWRYRDLIRMFVYRDFVVYYKQTVLGPLWWIIQPLLTTLIFALVFGMVAGLSTESLPMLLFYLSGTIIWNYFAVSMTNTASTFVDYRNIFTKVYFPRLAVPVAIVISNLMKMLIQLGLFLIIYLIYYLRGADILPDRMLIFLPFVLLYLAALGLGCGILIAAMTVKYRDLALAVPFLTQLWMYATPVIYPLSQVPSHLRFYFELNPVTPAVEYFRYAVFGRGMFQSSVLFRGIIITSILLFLGVILFSRVEKRFSDTI